MDLAFSPKILCPNELPEAQAIPEDHSLVFHSLDSSTEVMNRPCLHLGEIRVGEKGRRPRMKEPSLLHGAFIPPDDHPEERSPNWTLGEPPGDGCHDPHFFW